MKMFHTLKYMDKPCIPKTKANLEKMGKLQNF